MVFVPLAYDLARLNDLTTLPRELVQNESYLYLAQATRPLFAWFR